MCVCVCVSVCGDCSRQRPESSFSLATTPTYSVGRYSFLWIPQGLNKEASSTSLRVFGMTIPGIEPWPLGSLSKTLLARPMVRLVVYVCVYVYTHKHTKRIKNIITLLSCGPMFKVC